MVYLLIRTEPNRTQQTQTYRHTRTQLKLTHTIEAETETDADNLIPPNSSTNIQTDRQTDMQNFGEQIHLLLFFLYSKIHTINQTKQKIQIHSFWFEVFKTKN